MLSIHNDIINCACVVIPAKAENLLRVIILQLVRFYSINRDEVLRNKDNPS